MASCSTQGIAWCKLCKQNSLRYPRAIGAAWQGDAPMHIWLLRPLAGTALACSVSDTAACATPGRPASALSTAPEQDEQVMPSIRNLKKLRTCQRSCGLNSGQAHQTEASVPANDAVHRRIALQAALAVPGPAQLFCGGGLRHLESASMAASLHAGGGMVLGCRRQAERQRRRRPPPFVSKEPALGLRRRSQSTEHARSPGRHLRCPQSRPFRGSSCCSCTRWALHGHLTTVAVSYE